MSVELFTEDRLVYQFYPVAFHQFIFRVKAPNDAHIMLSTTPYESQPCYEIFFGGWGNTKSVIRKNQQQPDVYEAATPQILNANEFKSFWIRWDTVSGVLSAGVEGDLNPILHYQDQLPPIQHVGVCTGWGAHGHWFLELTPPAQQPGAYPPPAAPSPVSLSYPPIGFNTGAQQHAGPNPAFGFATTAPRWVQCDFGDVPPNAAVGGFDITGEKLYIARARHEGAVIPGKLVPSHKTTYVAWGGRENPKDSYEVLVDCNPRWQPMNGGQIPHGAFIAGQSEDGEPLYVGRSEHNGSTTPGKVQISHGVCYIPFNGEELAKSNFEIMVL